MRPPPSPRLLSSASPKSLFSLLRFLSSSCSSHHHHQQQPPPPSSPMGWSAVRVQKVIAAQADPLLAKEIFDVACAQPNFRPSYATFHTLILKLVRHRHFSLADSLLLHLRRLLLPVTPGLFSSLSSLYSSLNLPLKSISAFHSMLLFPCLPPPSSRHLNLHLYALSRHPASRPSALRLLSSSPIAPDTTSYNILISAFSAHGRRLSVSYSLFNRLLRHPNLQPNNLTYRLLMRGLCRRSQVSSALDLFQDMLNRGLVPDAFSYTTLLNALCRKKKLREAYALLCRMRVRGSNPNIIHFNTLILGLCREGRASLACKVLDDMPAQGCLPNLVSFHAIVSGLCDEGLLDLARGYLDKMIARGLSPHFAVFHKLVGGLCDAVRVDEAAEVLWQMLRHDIAPHLETWVAVVPRVCDEDGTEVERVVGELERRIGPLGIVNEEKITARKICVNTWKAAS